MSCQSCEKTVGRSCDTNPFVPPGGSVTDMKYECYCGQIWFQMNTHWHMWQKATAEEWEQWKKEAQEQSYYDY